MNNEQLKLILETLKEYNEALKAVVKLGTETKEMLEAHLIQDDGDGAVTGERWVGDAMEENMND